MERFSILHKKLMGKKDIFVDDGRIVKPDKSDLCKFSTSYDVDGMIVMAGAMIFILI